MLEVRVSHVIESLYDHTFRRRNVNTPEFDENHNTLRTAMLFTLDVRAHRYVEGEEGQASTFVHVLLCGNVHVWVYVGDEMDPFRVPLEEWNNTSNHDSCWRSDGISTPLSTVYFDLCQRAQECFSEEQRVAPKDVGTHVYFTFAGLGNLFQLAQVAYTRDGSAYYGFKLVALDRSTKRVEIVESEKE